MWVSRHLLTSLSQLSTKVSYSLFPTSYLCFREPLRRVRLSGMREGNLLVKRREHLLGAIAIKFLLFRNLRPAFVLLVGHGNASRELLQMGTWEAPLGWRNEACLCDIEDNGKIQDKLTESHCQSLDDLREERRRSLGKGKTDIVHSLVPPSRGRSTRLN